MRPLSRLVSVVAGCTHKVLHDTTPHNPPHNVCAHTRQCARTDNTAPELCRAAGHRPRAHLAVRQQDCCNAAAAAGVEGAAGRVPRRMGCHHGVSPPRWQHRTALAGAPEVANTALEPSPVARAHTRTHTLCAASLTARPPAARPSCPELSKPKRQDVHDHKQRQAPKGKSGRRNTYQRSFTGASEN